MREIQSGEYGCKIQLIKYNYAHNSKSTVATNLITIVTAHKDAWATERKETQSSHLLLPAFINTKLDLQIETTDKIYMMFSVALHEIILEPFREN